MNEYLICPHCGTSYKGNERHACASRDPLLQEREKTHGSFIQQGRWAQIIKDEFRGLPSWGKMTKAQCEVLDMIATKISRIGHGNPKTKDHWDDIAGYAKLGSEACE